MELLSEDKINQALEMQVCRPIDIFSTDFADWQTAVERSEGGNSREFLEICYAGIERLTNDREEYCSK